jgi:sugar O-acyltransferase (sialic acid O-acetyltransferase NeuD family)
MTKENEIGIIGSGGQAREVREYLNDDDMQPAFFAVNPEYISEEGDKINILSPSEYERITPVVAAIGAPEVRRRLVNEWPGDNYTKIISTHAYVGESVSIGKGSIIAPRAVLTADIILGEHTIINVGVTIAHDCRLGDYVTVSPGAHIAGNVELGDGVFVGIGATISNNIKIANGCVIGAGTVVIEDVLVENSVVVGVPGKVIKINDGWQDEI